MIGFNFVTSEGEPSVRISAQHLVIMFDSTASCSGEIKRDNVHYDLCNVD